MTPVEVESRITVKYPVAVEVVRRRMASPLSAATSV
jgi:hypothetical protein